jgi:hypothetical protein
MLLRVLVEVAHACPTGMATNYTFPQCIRRAATSRVYLLVFSLILSLQPRSLQNPSSTMRMGHVFWLNMDGSGEGVSGTPLP